MASRMGAALGQVRYYQPATLPGWRPSLRGALHADARSLPGEQSSLLARLARLYAVVGQEERAMEAHQRAQGILRFLSGGRADREARLQELASRVYPVIC